MKKVPRGSSVRPNENESNNDNNSDLLNANSLY